MLSESEKLQQRVQAIEHVKNLADHANEANEIPIEEIVKLVRGR